MEVGVFIPIGNNGWLLSENAPQYKPSFDLNKAITLKAEQYGFDFALSMIKLRGFGGKTEFWDYNLESFTLMAGLAAVTSKIKLFGTAATLVMPPAIVARMATTIDSISGGRFGINLITGWQRPEYSQMGLWPGDDYFGDRYEYLGEYTSVLKELLTEGQSDFKGKFFQMEDCQMKPVPQGDVKLICAGSSNSGMAFSAKFADYSFCFGVGVNTPKAFAPTNERLLAATEKSGREVKSVVLTMVLAEEKSEDAWAKWEHYKAGADVDAIKWLGLQSAVDTKSGSDTNVRHMSNPVSAVNINMGTLIGSYAEVAAMLDEMSEVPGTGGVMLTFDDFLEGVEKFGKYVQPLMKSRAHVQAELEGCGMSEAVIAGYKGPESRSESVTLPARPEPITLKPSETAVVVVDMQNAYSTEGGYVDLAGFDIAGAKGTIANIKKTLDAARAAGVQVIYFQNGWDKDYVEAGGPGSPNWHKSNALKTMRKRPELQGQLLAKGTWDYAIVDELQPQPGDILVPKTRYSGFFNTNMDSVLRARGIRNLVFVGIATNVCVESSLRDAFHLEYFGVMLEDATHHLGPDFIQQATVYNVEKFFGWVATVNDFCGVISQAAPIND